MAGLSTSPTSPSATSDEKAISSRNGLTVGRVVVSEDGCECGAKTGVRIYQSSATSTEWALQKGRESRLVAIDGPPRRTQAGVIARLLALIARNHLTGATMTRLLYAAALALLLFPPFAEAQNFDAGLAAAQAGDFATAQGEWRPLAEQGDARAQRYLGALYANGYGVSQDYVAAAKWYKRAADQGDAKAQKYLGDLYATGTGVPQDFAEAVKWFRLSAAQGEPLAQYTLGNMLQMGTGVAQNVPEAIRLYTLAAEQGHPVAQYNLGLMNVLGDDVPKNTDAALKWFGQAAEQNFAPAQHSLGVMYATGDGVPKIIVTAQMWFILASKDGYPNAVTERDYYTKHLSNADQSAAQSRAEACRASQFKHCD